MDTDKLTNTLGSAASSRRSFLKIAAMAGAGLGLGGVGVALPAQAATEDPPTVINVALTAELLAVAFNTTALANASAIGLTAAETTTVQAILATEALHVRYLQAYGAAPVPPYTNAFGQFYVPAGTFSSRTGFANAAVLAETVFVAAYMAATREFAADGRADLAQLTYQLGAVEAEHRAVARVVGGFAPYTDVAFEPNLLGTVTQAATVLTNLGIITSTPPAGAIPVQYFDVMSTNAINSYAGLLTKRTPGEEPTG